MKDDFTAEVMETIRAIDDYIEKQKDVTAIEQYYELFGTYDGVGEYINELAEKIHLCKV